MAGLDGGLPAYNAAVEGFCEHEYPMLKGNTYLDHAGTTLYSRSLVERATADMMGALLGNPHAASPSSQASSLMVDDVRIRALEFFGADPDAFDLVFVANATAGIKLVAEAFRALSGVPDDDGSHNHGGFSFAYHQASHTSLVGVREEATSSACLTSDDVEGWIAGSLPAGLDTAGHMLFAYPAQSNMDGQRYPLSWASTVREASAPGPTWTLLDAASYASTSPLDLHDAAAAPDFVVLSFYKIFGFPDLGALLVRRPAEAVFAARRYFGGGTVDLVVCSPGSGTETASESWHASRETSLHERLEDGTLPIHAIAALGAALDTHATLFGSMNHVAAHTCFLADRLRLGLASLHHGSGAPACEIYGHGQNTGPIVAFNLRNAAGAWVGLVEFDKLAALRRFHIRTGGVCNPGGIADALGLAPWELRRNFAAGLRCGGSDDDEIVAGKPTGIIRASLGAMSTKADVDRFLAFLVEFYCDKVTPPPPALCTVQTAPSLVVSAINVYPIKSCGALRVPAGCPWEIRPEGLAWDREWCLVHRGTGRALSQKQYPQMVLLRPQLDFVRGVLRVVWGGKQTTDRHREICVPLSSNPAMFAPTPSAAVWQKPSPRWPSRVSRVCGEEICAQVYTAEAINAFFSGALGVPCSLARFPPGGHGKSMRHAKAHLQKHQTNRMDAPPSPPESDSDGHGADGMDRQRPVSSDNSEGSESEVRVLAPPTTRRRILLSNESPILVIHMASVRALNTAIRAKMATTSISPDVFRANIVLDTVDGDREDDSNNTAAYLEDGWSCLHIGRQSFRALGACRRCHMVCIHQHTGVRSDEPFTTLSQTRRFDGKVFFGIHMAHDPDMFGDSAILTPEQQYPTITVGDAVEVEV